MAVMNARMVAGMMGEMAAHLADVKALLVDSRQGVVSRFGGAGDRPSGWLVNHIQGSDR